MSGTLGAVLWAGIWLNHAVGQTDEPVPTVHLALGSTCCRERVVKASEGRIILESAYGNGPTSRQKVQVPYPTQVQFSVANHGGI